MPYKDKNSELAKRKKHESYKRYYAKNKEKYYENSKKQSEKIRRQIDEIKSVPCLDCGNTFLPCVMDFDHRDRTAKVDDISTLIRRGNWSILMAEIEKCDIICSNCHRVRTYEGNHYSHSGLKSRRIRSR